MSNDFNVNHISYRFYCDKLVSMDLSNNLIIESSNNNIEFKSANQTISFNNNSVFNYGLTLNNRDLSNIINIAGNTLNIDTLFVTDITNSQATIDDYNSINNGYIRATTIGYNPSILNDISGRSDAYFTYINVSGGDSSFNNSVYIKNILGVSGATTISNDLIVNGKSFVTLYNAISNYIANIKEELSSNKILTLDLSATNISVSNELVVNKTSFLNNISIYGQLLDNVLKVPHDFTIDPIVPIVYNFQYYSWTSINSSYTGFWKSVCWSPALELFVSVISNNNNYYVLYSYNGTVWFPGTPSSYNAQNGVCWSQERGMFVAVGYELMYSYNGITWSSTNVSGVDASISWNAPCWSPELSIFVASSNGGTSSNSNVMYSYNGINWTQTSQIIPNNSWSTPCWSPHLRIFVAVAQTTSNNVMYSDDGKNWTLKTATDNYYFKSVCWSAELVMFVAVASSASNNVMYSYDGIDWTTISFGSGWSNICWSAQLGIFLAITSYGNYKVMYSYDGINWSQQNIVTPENSWLSICWSPELKIFVGVGNTSNVMISSLPARSNSGTLIINGDLIVYGNRTTIGSNIIEISDITLSVATNLMNANDLYNNNAGLDISNVASIKYDGTNWNFIGGQLTVENKKVSLDVSLVALKTSTEISLNSLNSYFDVSYIQLKNNLDNSYNATYNRNQIDASFLLKSDFDISLLSFNNNLDISYVNLLTFDASFSALKSYLDASYIIKGNISNPDIIDNSLNFLRDKLDLSYVLKSTFEGSYNSLKDQIDISFGSIRLTSLDTPTISVDTINTKHFTQRFNNILWNQIGLDISNGPPLTNNNKKVAISNDGKVVALSSSSHSDISKGRVYVYELTYNQASYNWRQLGISSEIIVGLSNDDQFGWDIALSSNGRVVAGSSIVSDASGINCGQVRLFELSNNNVWRQKGFNINGPRAGSESGYSISLAGNGNRIAIGSWKDNSNGTNAGAVRVYDFSANVNDWRQQGQTIAGVSGSFEGYATALSLDGQTLASAGILPISISGGTISISGEYIIHSFTTTGTSTFTSSFSGSVEVLIVGGGGAGGTGVGGGGGAGGVIYMPAVNVSNGVSYEIVVGIGGIAAAFGSTNPGGTNGQNSTAFNAIAAGGGTGGYGYGGYLPLTGGSGGGGGNSETQQLGAESSGNSLGGNNGFIYGNRGGNRTSGTPRGGGGGGAGGSGIDNITSGAGGIGIQNSILGPNYYWGGGGGGGGNSNAGAGGLGGGGGGNFGAGAGGGSALNSGSPGNNNNSGGAGGANTGGGGGAGPWAGGAYGGAGGSGIVVIRYLTASIPKTQVKTFTISGTTWTPKGTINGYDISFGRAIKLSANGNAIVIGAPGYTNEYRIPPIYELNSTSMTWQNHRTNALTVFGRDLAVILDASQNAQVNALRNGTMPYLGGRRRTGSSNANGKTSLDWEWVTGDVWNYHAFPSNQPDTTSETFIHMYYGDGGWNDINSFGSQAAVYMYYKARILNVGQAYVYGYQGGTTWTQLGQAIQGISGGDEFGSSVSISNDGKIIAIGSDNNSSNRGQVRVFGYANNYWTQLSNAIDGKTLSSKAGIHALAGDGTTLIQSNNTYNSVYGINKNLVFVAPSTAINTTISGDLVVTGKAILKSLKISNKFAFDTSGAGYSSNYLATTDISSSIVDYYSNVGYTYNKVFKIDACGNISNYSGVYGSISDSRLKENIVTSAPKLEDMLKVRVVNYRLKGSDQSKYIGLLAQELEELFPELVLEDNSNEKFKSINYSSLTIMLIKALQEQQVLINNLITTLEDMEKKIII